MDRCSHCGYSLQQNFFHIKYRLPDVIKSRLQIISDFESESLSLPEVQKFYDWLNVIANTVNFPSSKKLANFPEDFDFKRPLEPYSSTDIVPLQQATLTSLKTDNQILVIQTITGNFNQLRTSDLYNHFSKYGKIKNLEIVKLNKKKPIAFCEFVDFNVIKQVFGQALFEAFQEKWYHFVLPNSGDAVKVSLQCLEKSFFDAVYPGQRVITKPPLPPIQFNPIKTENAHLFCLSEKDRGSFAHALSMTFITDNEYRSNSGIFDKFICYRGQLATNLVNKVCFKMVSSAVISKTLPLLRKNNLNNSHPVICLPRELEADSIEFVLAYCHGGELPLIRNRHFLRETALVADYFGIEELAEKIIDFSRSKKCTRSENIDANLVDKMNYWVDSLKYAGVVLSFLNQILKNRPFISQKIYRCQKLNPPFQVA